MNENEFLEFIRELGIPQNKSYRELRELIEIKMAEFQDSPLYMEDGGSERQERFDSAIDYAEKLQRAQESGIAIETGDGAEDTPAAQDTPSGVDALKARTESTRDASDSINMIDTSTPSAAAQGAPAQGAQTTAGGGAAASAVWFRSITGADNVDNLFIQAMDCITYDEWEKADRILENIISVEPRNPGAFLAKAFIDFRIKDVKAIETFTDNDVSRYDLIFNTHIRRARDYGDNAQNAQITHLLDANESYRKYLQAEKSYQSGKYQEAEGIFSSISGYRDADARAEDCRNKDKEEQERQQENSYNEAMSTLRSPSSDSAALKAARNKMASVGDYKDAKEQLAAFDKAIEEKQEEERANEEAKNRVEARVQKIGERRLRKAQFLRMLPFIVILTLLGPGLGDFVEPNPNTREGWMPQVETFLHRFVPVAVTSSYKTGRVYLGIGSLHVDPSVFGLPVIAPLADSVFVEVSDNDDIEELDIDIKGGRKFDLISVSDCDSLQTLSIANDTKYTCNISDCDSLTSIVISGDIGSTIRISGCASLTDVYVTAEKYESGDVWIEDCPLMEGREPQIIE